MGSPRVSVSHKGGVARKIGPPVGIPAKRLHKSRKGSSTAGSTKGIKPPPWIRVYCRRNRSHQWPRYAEFKKKVGQRKTSAAG